MKFSYYSIYQSNHIKIQNASLLRELGGDSILSQTYERGTLSGETSAFEFRKLYGCQLAKGRQAIGNYNFFIYNQLIEADLPCLFFMPNEGKRVRKETEGIATKFASLKTDKDILNFAKEYGLLGVVTPSVENIAYGVTVFEPIYFWKFYINEIKKLLKLYKMLKKKIRNKKIDIIGELISFKEKNGTLEFKWREGGCIPFNFEINQEDIDYENYDAILGANIFTTSVSQALKGAIHLDFSDLVYSKDTEIGFRMKEIHCTNYLLGAIYYDLWNLFNNDKGMNFCAHCGNPFTKSGRKKYCCDSCKTLAYLARKENKG